MIKAVVFDLDGVIVSTDLFHYKSWKSIADREGIPFDHEINNRLRGVSRKESLEIILELATRSYSEAEKIALMNAKNAVYVQLLDDLSANDVLPGVIILLDWLDRHGIQKAIGSSSKNAKLILSQIGLSDRFPVVVDGHMIKHSKPHPEVFTLAAELLGVKAKETLVVEDAMAGIDAALAAGMTAAAIGDALRHSGAHIRLSRADDLILFLGR